MAKGEFAGPISAVIGRRVIASVDLKTNKVTMMNYGDDCIDVVARDVTQKANDGQPENNLLKSPEKDANIKG